ncbi:MAG: excisionase family DNA-binding protein, partial [Acidimicrobiales bacterium]
GAENFCMPKLASKVIWISTEVPAALDRSGNGRRGLAPKTIHSIYEMLHKALTDGEHKGSVIRNVVALSDPPKQNSATKRDMRVSDAERLRTFLDGIGEHRLFPTYTSQANTGMRWGSSGCAGELVGPGGEQAPLPAEVYPVLRQVVDVMRQGQATLVAPKGLLLTTQEAADFLGVSRPTLVKLLEDGVIPFDKPSRPDTDRQKRPKALAGLHHHYRHQD